MQMGDKFSLTKEEFHELEKLVSEGKSENVNKYIFRCQICAEIVSPVQWYKIKLNNIKETSDLFNLQKGYNEKNLTKIKEDDKTDYKISSLNLTRSNEYVCDNCQKNVFRK